MKKGIIALGICLFSLIALFSGCFNNLNVPESLTQLSITSFTVTPTVIKSGDMANLSWLVIGASSVSIDHEIGNVSLMGSRVIMPTETTIYTLTAKNTTTIITASTQIIVTGETSENHPVASMSQSGASITISGITNGPVTNHTGDAAPFAPQVSINCINKTSGLPNDLGAVIQNSSSNNAGPVTGGGTNPQLLKGGDLVVFNSARMAVYSSGDQWTIQLIYKSSIIGTCTFTKP